MKANAQIVIQTGASVAKLLAFFNALTLVRVRVFLHFY
jgi:uncharacterized protein (DUF433 family)